jgi:hypothetical protein
MHIPLYIIEHLSSMESVKTEEYTNNNILISVSE